MSIIDSLLNLFAPHLCLGCGNEGSLLCDACSHGLVTAQTECYFCRQPALDSVTCDSCFERAGLRQVVVATLYSDQARQLVRKLKFNGAQAAAGVMAGLLPSLEITGELIVVPVPTATSRVRGRGYDQAELLGRALAKRQGHSYLPCLRRYGQSHQVGADRSARLSQLAEAFIVARPERIRGKQVLLVDDVITTGATFEAAALVLHAAGTAGVSAVAFARPEYDGGMV